MDSLQRPLAPSGTHCKRRLDHDTKVIDIAAIVEYADIFWQLLLLFTYSPHLGVEADEVSVGEEARCDESLRETYCKVLKVLAAN
ncbi:hypothetical protein AQ750_20245 [Burkholderia pseudomallei]|nr:hypothetical protein AQ727_26060 [Burkholderia pseudomallei]OMS19711.1 hypothetical protein AQ736_01355 [Burkholderia pseudomallei]OMS35782.1 hypothetical protein AQ739_29290 [Burkholderia pseudomallei]OMS99998.1 hypothetical protein AQ752_29690 [Burkholderia pseudomallei]OMT04766.1 hypothetical protein AQ750_20245 [Burkholderia pseudomallei]